MAMAGAGLIVQQTFVTQSHDSPESGAHTRLLGFSIAIAGAMANGIVFVSLQAMGPSIELRYQVKWFAIFVANITSIMPFATSNPSFQIRADLNLKAWFLNFSIGLLGFLMEVFTAGGFKGNNCVDAAQMTYIQPLLALVLEWVLRGNRPTSLALFGSTIVLGSATIMLISAVHKPKRITADCDEESNRLLVSTEIYG
ncbi:hypothetical protein GQ44DRAFT_832967 [Phaeosphaeriaceae sp. PMI808]|nr:hypothetical protein GQ44DRAFT_832967 [Phaeosphaeriaceae sp. PMI808]